MNCLISVWPVIRVLMNCLISVSCLMNCVIVLAWLVIRTVKLSELFPRTWTAHWEIVLIPVLLGELWSGELVMYSACFANVELVHVLVTYESVELLQVCGCTVWTACCVNRIPEIIVERNCNCGAWTAKEYYCGINLLRLACTMKFHTLLFLEFSPVQYWTVTFYA